MPDQSFKVSYVIDVDASKGAKKVNEFAGAVEKLMTAAKGDLTPLATQLKKTLTAVDKIFRSEKTGRKRDFSYKFNIDTSASVEKLAAIKQTLGEIQQLAQGIHVVVNPGEPLKSSTLKAKVRRNVTALAADAQKQTTAEAVTSILDMQRRVTKSVGKVRGALTSLERGYRLNVQTDEATAQLNSILALLGQIKRASNISLGLRPERPVTGEVKPSGVVKPPYIYAPRREFTLPENVNQRLQERLYTNDALQKQRASYAAQERAQRLAMQQQMADMRRIERERQALIKAEAEAQKRTLAEQIRQQKEQERRTAQAATAAVRANQRKSLVNDGIYGAQRRAAINRIQYAKAPSWRNLPMAYMFSGYMLFGAIKSELQKAIDYANIMESAHSILKVADGDMATFESRFEQMARHVRTIGVDTKYTAVEIAGATKYLAMAGLDIETINRSIRPITNLALIGDNDVAQIADLTTNIQTGYNVKNTSMDSVADILASTVSRSNVNIIEMAESYKMAAGYLRMAGVEFSESAAAIGLLGNMGIKGTMAGTSLRALAARFAKPTREARKILDKLGVKFTHMVDIEGRQVEKLRPLADIFEEMKKKKATLGDMQAIFSKYGGNAAMMFMENYDKLRESTVKNRNSYGISSELAQVKQQTTKGLWAQVTSQFTEGFMQGYELIEPVIRSTLKKLLGKFKAPEFARGIASIGQTLLDLLGVLGNIATWFIRNFEWIEPLLFTGFVATKLFKLAAAITNVGVAVGFLGKQSVAGSTMQLLSGLVGMKGGSAALSFAKKRALVTAMRGMGVAGKGAMGQALLTAGAGGASMALGRGAFPALFSSQVATGNGMVGAAASLSALGTGAIVATGAIAGLVGMLGWVAYKMWKVKQAKDAVLEEIEANRKYRYPSIEKLHESLRNTYEMATKTKLAIDDLSGKKTIQEESGVKVGAFTGKWGIATLAEGSAMIRGARSGVYVPPSYTIEDARQDDLRKALTTLADKHSQSKIDAAYARLGKMTTKTEVNAFMRTISKEFGYTDEDLDKTLFSVVDGKAYYIQGVEDLPAARAAQTYDYAHFINTTVLPDIFTAAETYRNAIATQQGALNELRSDGFNFEKLEKWGYAQDKEGKWYQKSLGKNATEDEMEAHISNRNQAHQALVRMASTLRTHFGGSAEIAENILLQAGFSRSMFSNEPDSANERPFDANGIMVTGVDDAGAGGNYSGTGKLSSAAPKQVIVNIENLMSIETVDLMKTQEGQTSEIQNLKEQLSQALIDVVHDFDASWNA